MISFVATLRSLFYVVDYLGTTGDRLADWKLLYVVSTMHDLGTIYLCVARVAVAWTDIRRGYLPPVLAFA
jgi:hypothetical protein